MRNTGLPRLADILAERLIEAVLSTPDRWVRAEIPPEWPVATALSRAKARTPGLRIGVLHPFPKLSVAKTGCQVTTSAQEITQWRNQRIEVRRAKPTIVLGDARGREEAGLRMAPRILRDDEVLRRFREAVLRWLKEHVNSDTPRPVFDYLFELASDGTVDAVRLDEYVGSVLAKPDQVLGTVRSELWGINLFPDARVLDSGMARSRLQRNIETRQLLLAATDTPGELKRLERLREAAKGGNRIAKRALQYREEQNREHLKGVDLEALLEIISPHAPPVPLPPRPLHLFEFLDEAAEANPDLVREVLNGLASGWDLESPETEELITTFSRPGQESREVRVEVVPEPSEERFWVADGTPEKQVIALVAESGSRRDWLPLPAEGMSIRGDLLLTRARSQDVILKQPLFETLVNQYLAARAGLIPYEKWLRRAAFPLLLLNAAAREALREYLDSWQALVDAAGDPEREAGVIRGTLILLEGVWGRTAKDSFEWCVLGPLHPYVLDPCLSLADYALASLGQPELGRKVAWALDHSLPAYRAMWAPDATLFLSREDDLYEFELSPGGYHPRATGGDGVYQVARSFLGFHAFAREALVITLVDPPRGGAIMSNLRRLRRDVGELRVYLVTTSGDAAQLEEAGDLIRNLGRFSSIKDWLDRAQVRSHIVFYFAERPAGSAVAARTGWGPTPGAHIALKVSVKAPSSFEISDRLVPFVTFEPRQNNGPVLAIQRLAAPNLGSPRLFEVKPSMTEEEAAAFAETASVADWLVIGAPAPLGLVAPRKFGHGLTYLGREVLGPYGLFVYATTLFPVRRLVTEGLRPAPVVPNSAEVEQRLTELALESTNGVLRIGRAGDGGLWEQIGLMISSALSRGLDV